MFSFRKRAVRVAQKDRPCNCGCGSYISRACPEVEIKDWNGRDGWLSRYYLPKCYFKIQQEDDPPLENLPGAEKLKRKVQTTLLVSPHKTE